MANKDNNGYEDKDMNIFTLTDEDGQEFEFELLDYVDYDDKLYTLLIPVDDGQDADEDGIVVMLTEFEGEEPVFTFVDDENLAQEVLDSYVKYAEQAANEEESDAEDEDEEDDE